MRDALDGPIATPDNTPPPTRSDGDRAGAQLVDAYKSDPEKAQVMLDRRNALGDAQEQHAAGTAADAPSVPIPEGGQPAQMETLQMQYFHNELARQPGGEDLIREWGSSFQENAGHALAALTRARAEMPEMSNLLDSLPPQQQAKIAPQLLRYLATLNRRHGEFMGVQEFAPPPSAPPAWRGDGRREVAPSMGPAPALMGNAALSADVAIERATAEAIGLHQAGRRLEAEQAFRQRDALIERKLGRNAHAPPVGRFGRTI